MGGGLVFFGIGGATNGGLLNAFNGSSGGSGSNPFTARLKAAQRRVAVSPNDPAAWAQLTQLRFEVANVPANLDQSGNYTPTGRTQLVPVQQAWDRYLALAKTPDPNLATEMMAVLGPSGLGAYPAAAQAAEVVASARPGYAIFAQLAELSYLAREVRKGNLAATKAESLAPAATKSTLTTQLQAFKAQATRTTSTSGATGASGTAASGGAASGGAASGTSSTPGH
jgi:hypothetical protein